MEGIYDIVVEDVVRTSDLKHLDPSIRARILTAIREKLTTTPEYFGKPLRHTFKKARSLRVGNYRVLFTIIDKTVSIAAIFHRSASYQAFEQRLSDE
jgi:mRNA interferase RelE/StbE